MAQKYATQLYYGLPAVLKDEEWIIFSPYAGEVVRIPMNDINDGNIKDSLTTRGFFGSPSPLGPGQLGDYFQLTLITTSNCNLRCRYCFANAGDSDFRMSEKVAFASVRYGLERAAGRKLLISFFGGEPSLTPDLVKSVVDYAREKHDEFGVKDVMFNITTNGVIGKGFLEFLIQNDFFLTISMDGIPAVQNDQRPLKNGSPSSPLVEETIKTLVASKHEFMVRATVTKNSVNSLPETAVYLSHLGVSQFHCEAINLAGRAIMETKGQPMERPTAEEFIENLIRTIECAADNGMNVLNSAYMNLLQPSVHFCDGVGGNRCSVTYLGEITTCLEVQGGCHPTADFFIVGCYDEDRDSIIINPRKRANVCGSPIIESNKACRDCFARFVCGGGCPIRNYHTTGDIATIDPFRCNVIHEVLPYVLTLLDACSE